MSCRTACGRVWAPAPTCFEHRKIARRRRNPGSRGGLCGRPRAGTSPAPTEHFGRAVPAAADLCRGRCPHRPAPTSKRRKIARRRRNPGSRGGLYGRPRAGTSPAPTEHFGQAMPAAADLCRGRCPHRPAPTSKRRKIARRRRNPGSRGGLYGRPRAGTSPAPTEHFGRAVPAAADLCRGRCPHRPAPPGHRPAPGGCGHPPLRPSAAKQPAGDEPRK